jgi:hypothetical protein
MPELDCIESTLLTTGWNRARVRLLARFLVALIGGRGKRCFCAAFLVAILMRTLEVEILARFLSGTQDNF